MASFPPVPVDTPSPRGLRYGLLTAANGPLDLPEHARGGSIVYEPVSCGFARLDTVECSASDGPTMDDADDLVYADAFLAYATYVCGSVGKSPAQMEDKVRQRLANGEQTIAEAGLADALSLAAVPLVPGDADDFRQVIGELEQWLYGIDGAAYGNRGYLHAPIRYAVLAARNGLLIADGPAYRTPIGTIWSFGGGYPDDGRIFVTGNTTVYRSPDVDVPPAREVFNRSTNQYRMLAQREYAVAYDCVAAVADYTGDPAAS